jgi:hypothetical protein
MLMFDTITLESRLLKDSKFNAIVGAYDVFSSRGEFYPLTNGVKKLYEDSPFMDKVRNGGAELEVQHPPFFKPIEEWLQRLHIIKPDNVCGRIIDIAIDDKPTPVPGQPKPVYLVRANIEPYGAKKEILESRMSNPNEPLAYSLRAMNEAEYVNGVLYKEVTIIFTYDLVDLPGISCCASRDKWKTFGIESQDYKLTNDDILDINHFLNTVDKVTIEDGRIDFSSIRDVISSKIIRENKYNW